jgi:acyl phosphate:glycerol-3-phosphate acyltransferase
MPTETITIDTTTIIIGICFALAAYMIGSLSSAVIYCKIFKLPDPRTAGSGNPGATNVLRLAGKKAAICVLLGDVLKGIIPVFIAKLFFLSPVWIGVVAVATLLGHLYPIFFGFKGGKGVATAGGICMGLSWPFGLAVLAIWVFIALITRISSLAALTASGAAPILAYVMVDWQTALLMVVIALLIIWKHRENIQRLREGTEPKIDTSST